MQKVPGRVASVPSKPSSGSLLKQLHALELGRWIWRVSAAHHSSPVRKVMSRVCSSLGEGAALTALFWVRVGLAAGQQHGSSRIMESWNILRWRGHMRIVESNSRVTESPELDIDLLLCLAKSKPDE